MATDPNGPIRRVVEEEEMVAPRGEDADHTEEAEPIIEPDGEAGAMYVTRREGEPFEERYRASRRPTSCGGRRSARLRG